MSYARQIILLAVMLVLFTACTQHIVEEIDAHYVTRSAVDLDEIIARDTLKAITVYSSTSYFIYKGQPMGFEYEMLEKFAKQLDVELQMVIAEDMDEMFAMLARGEGDLIAHGLTITKSRKEQVSFTQPIMTTRQVLVQRKQGNWLSKNNQSQPWKLIDNLTDLDGKTVVVGQSSVFRQRLMNLSEEIGIQINIVNADPCLLTEELIQQVSNGDIEFTVADEYVARLNATFLPNIDCKIPISLQRQLGWAVQPNSTQLLDSLNAWLASMENSLEYAMLYNRYYKYRKDFTKKKQSPFYAQRFGNISPYDELIQQYADTLGWDWRLLAAQVYQESKFNPDAKSWTGAQGLMQMMPGTAAAMGVSNLTDPDASIQGGVKYLVSLNEFWEEITDDNERVKFVLASYNAGPYHVKDAQRLALKYHANPCVWNDNVAYYLTQKAKPKFYNDVVVKNGYCRGTEPTKYVEEILKRYGHYSQVLAGL